MAHSGIGIGTALAIDLDMIGYGKQDLNQDDLDAVAAVLAGDYLTCGPAVDAFETAIAEVSQAPHVVAVSNGTSALRLLYQIAGVGPGKIVGVPAITFVATASQALLLGAEIVLLDVDPQSLLLTPEILEDCNHKLDYVVPVHMAGRLCDMRGIASWAEKNNAMVLEDAAHAFGSELPDSYVAGDCSLSDGAIFSFHPVKNITCGEGGAICVKKQAWSDDLKRLRHHGVQPAAHSNDPWMHHFNHPATNERLSDIHAALGRSQVQRLALFKQRRQDIVNNYVAAFSELNFINCYPQEDQQAFWHLAIAHIDWQQLGMDRNALFDYCKQRGVQLQVHYIPLHHQPMLNSVKRASHLKGAESAYEAVVSLPCYPALTDAEQAQVIALFQELA